MTLRPRISTIALALAFFIFATAFAQTPETSPTDAVRVTVALNADGSRTVYEFDNVNHKATATTTDAEGKLRGKIRFDIDAAGRFSSGIAFGPDERFLFKSLYKYDSAGRLEQETHLGKDDAVINKIVYKYNPAGKQIGYSVFDASGKLISGTSSPTPTVSPKRHNALGR